MYGRRHWRPIPERAIVKMDPDCAVCHAPSTAGCDCESKGLEMAIRQAEARMMQTIYSDIRTWVKDHAQDYILQYFTLLANRRKETHSAHLEHITNHAYTYYHAPPHPAEIAQAQAVLKRGIDEDWQASVQRYPDVLSYFYGLVELSLPPEDDSAVRDPPLSAMNGSRKISRRSRPLGVEGGGGGGGAGSSRRDRSRQRDRERAARTPPPPPPPLQMGGMAGMGLAGMQRAPMPPDGGRRTPGLPPPSGRRTSGFFVPPPPSMYHPGY